ncbi:MAG TPA: hypothetical protein PL033_21040 [Candidatus Brocadiia bacterium]|nr:hypothetical protein [Candidatus Brocadiia bacterium]
MKCCDEIVSSKQRWSHIEILKIAEEPGFEAVDLFILHRTSPAMVQEKRQKHARKNHSFTWVFRSDPDPRCAFQ